MPLTVKITPARQCIVIWLLSHHAHCNVQENKWHTLHCHPTPHTSSNPYFIGSSTENKQCDYSKDDKGHTWRRNVQSRQEMSQSVLNPKRSIPIWWLVVFEGGVGGTWYRDGTSYTGVVVMVVVVSCWVLSWLWSHSCWGMMTETVWFDVGELCEWRVGLALQMTSEVLLPLVFTPDLHLRWMKRGNLWSCFWCWCCIFFFQKNTAAYSFHLMQGLLGCLLKKPSSHFEHSGGKKKTQYVRGSQTFGVWNLLQGKARNKQFLITGCERKLAFCGSSKSIDKRN